MKLIYFTNKEIGNLDYRLVTGEEGNNLNRLVSWMGPIYGQTSKISIANFWKSIVQRIGNKINESDNNNILNNVIIKDF
jgi:hypothetical protein